MGAWENLGDRNVLHATWGFVVNIFNILAVTVTSITKTVSYLDILRSSLRMWLFFFCICRPHQMGTLPELLSVWWRLHFFVIIPTRYFSQRKKRDLLVFSSNSDSQAISQVLEPVEDILNSCSQSILLRPIVFSIGNRHPPLNTFLTPCRLWKKSGFGKRADDVCSGQKQNF